MKIRVEKDELAEAVSWAARTLPSRPIHPGVRLSGEGDLLHISTFDVEVATRAEVGAVIDEPGVTIVSGKLLAEIARALPNQPVEMGLESNRLMLRCGRSLFGLPTQRIEDSPQMPELPPDTGEVSAADFAAAIGQVAIAASRDDMIPPLTGIRVELSPSTITLAATDRYRLAVREIPWRAGAEVGDSHALVKARQLTDLGRALGHADDVRISLGESDEGLIGFSVAGRELITRLLHGDFPKYRQLLPSEAATVAITDTAALIEAVKRVKLVLLAAERTNPIRLTFSDGEVLLRAGAFDDAQATDSLECSIEGDPLEIAFNPDYLLDGLAALGSEQVSMSFTAATKPAVLRPAGQGTADYQYLLMPVRLGG